MIHREPEIQSRRENIGCQEQPPGEGDIDISKVRAKG